MRDASSRTIQPLQIAGIWVGAWLCVAMVAITGTAQAVTLPFSTTYNCAENNQDSGNWPNCDGLSAWGGWHAVAGSGEQITTAANYSVGGRSRRNVRLKGYGPKRGR